MKLLLGSSGLFGWEIQRSLALLSGIFACDLKGIAILSNEDNKGVIIHNSKIFSYLLLIL